MPRIDHSADIAKLRKRASTVQSQDIATGHDLAADLLDMHDHQAISLDSWPTARKFVERRTGRRLVENQV